MSKRRLDSRLGENSQEVQIWNSVKAQLNSLVELQEKVEATSRALQSAQQANGKGKAPLDLEANLNALRNSYQAQLDESIESLSILIALRENPDPYSQGLPEKRKKRNAASSLQPSRSTSAVVESNTPSSSIPSSPAPSGRSSGSPAPSSLSTGPSRINLVKANGSSPLGSIITGNVKNRKAFLNRTGQLPLRPGRSVVAKPNKGTGTIPGGSPNGSLGERGRTGEDDWILGEIVECISGDKNRYVVKDSDPTSEDARWNMTLKTIIPLPDPKDRERTYPKKDYTPGMWVLALYPDTTSFYKAKIVGMGANRHYMLLFEEDEDTTREVPEEYVTEYMTS
ncbi:hypothetical protein BT69DRAFT_1333310 [Atractiella rhizophila]|nr:hypothetical protein BT69DRAFT_1344624 [Atractiella rhizophila]KAH8924032.1 hypothetical protein BT69DRAFT_1333310 [Atractiella rhizophila]